MPGGKIQAVEFKTSQKTGSPYKRIQIDGVWYTARGAVAAGAQQGDDCTFAFTVNGDFKNLTELNVTNAVQKANTQDVRQAFSKGRDPQEANLMMLTRYALDAMLAKPDLTPEAAVEIVITLMRYTKDRLAPDQPQGSEQYKQAALNVAKACQLQVDDPMFQDYLKRMKFDWSAVLQDMADYQGKRKNLVVNGEGLLLFVPKA